MFVGHDWGALIVWDLIRLHPERVRGVVGVSVPFVNWPAPPTQLFRQTFGDNFFYILYFQEVGPAERELGADARRTMHNVLWSASAAGADRERELRPAAGTGFLDVMGEWPAELPPWLSAEDLDRYTAAFETSGFFGPVSYYRNLDADYERVKDISPSTLTMPSFFIGGLLDMVIALDPSGIDRMPRPAPRLPGRRADPRRGALDPAGSTRRVQRRAARVPQRALSARSLDLYRRSWALMPSSSSISGGVGEQASAGLGHLHHVVGVEVGPLGRGRGPLLHHQVAVGRGNGPAQIDVATPGVHAGEHHVLGQHGEEPLVIHRVEAHRDDDQLHLAVNVTFTAGHAPSHLSQRSLPPETTDLPRSVGKSRAQDRSRGLTSSVS